MRLQLRPSRPFAFLLCATALFAALTPADARAAGGADAILDSQGLLTLEQRAAAAQPRERYFLYSEILHGWTELAGRNMADGKDTEAASAMAHADADLAQLRSTLTQNSRRLINAELLLGRSAHHLSDMVRVATQEQHDSMQTVLKHLNSVHDELLAQIFAH